MTISLAKETALCYNFSMQNTDCLNEIYKVLDERKDAVKTALKDYSPKSGYYNGHYYRNDEGQYEITYYPIPVVEIRGLCDVEINLDDMSVSTKLEKRRIPSFDLSVLGNVYFECTGVDDYLADLYRSDLPRKVLLKNVERFPEDVISFCFTLEKDDLGSLVKLVSALKEHGFFY